MQLKQVLSEHLVSDEQTTLATVKKVVDEFVTERKWGSHHSPKNISMSIAIEAAELMEHFQFCDSTESYRFAHENKPEVSHELADIVVYALIFARQCNIDITQAIAEKLIHTDAKYPVEKVTGSFENYRALKKEHKKQP